MTKKPDEVEVKKVCPSCQGELLVVDDKNLYCEKEDITFSLNKGKVTFSSEQNKGRIQQLEEALAEQTFTLEKLIKKLFGPQEGQKDFWEL